MKNIYLKKNRVAPMIILILSLLSSTSCKKKNDNQDFILLSLISFFSSNTQSPFPCDSCYNPGIGDTWQWQLSGTVNDSYNVKLYDIDLFDSSAGLIDNLQSGGKKVICYFSAGSYENWREDAGTFPDEVKGNPLDGWAGERWLDIRSSAVLSIMKNRLDLAAQKGCDGVEPDNMDGYTNASGFPLTAGNQLAYNKKIANEAHKRGLFVALKNDGAQTEELEPYFDLALNEQCHEYDECADFDPFLNAEKPVLNAEYADVYVNDTAGARTDLCATALLESIRTLVLPLDLDGSFRYSCD